MSSKDDFGTALLRKYGLARIGTPVNYVTGKVDVERSAFSMTKLAGLPEERIEQNVNTRSEQTSQAHAYSTSDQEASSSSKATKLAGVPFSRMALESHTSKSNSQLDTANGMSLTIEMAMTGSELLLHTKDMSEEEFYSCAEVLFKAALDKLAAAKTPEAWRDAYKELTKAYGHGFVSRLKLISCAAGRLQAKYTSTGNQQEQRHGRGISCRTGKGGMSSAKEWADDQVHSASDGTVQSSTEALPAESPCQTWVSDWVTEYSEKELTAIQKDPPAIPPAPSTKADPPVINAKEPGKSPLPKMEITNTDELLKYMQLEQMASDGVDVTKIAPGTHQQAWEDYQNNIENDASALNENDIAQDGGAANTGSPTASLGISDSARPESNQFARGAEGVTGAASGVNFGSYAISGLEFTAYKDIFPSLMREDFDPSLSRSTLYFAKVHMFIMTRQLIASYLKFLSLIPSYVTGGHVTPQFAGDFASAVGEFIAKVSDEVVTSDAGYHESVGWFDTILQKKSESAGGVAVYRCFVKNFSVLSKAPYGFLLSIKDAKNTWYPRWGRWTNDYAGLKDGPVGSKQLWFEGSRPSVETGILAADSYRLYPIVVGGKNPGVAFAFYIPASSASPDKSWCAVGASANLSPGAEPEVTWAFKEHTNPSGTGTGEFSAINVHVNDQPALSAFQSTQPYFQNQINLSDHLMPVTLTPLGYKEVHDYPMHGIPMWYQPSFELIKEGLK
jgi:hypothetical protein